MAGKLDARAVVPLEVSAYPTTTDSFTGQPMKMPESTAPPSDGITDPNTVRPSADPREWPSDEQDTITPEKTPAPEDPIGHPNPHEGSD
ncbi:hypothetical protein PSHT_09921 [Puccinia striiformis]|uniref:Uncharacterized protein n=1 Tax=Puccinia striiformis TaxID=27350 RepID=A0A2S4VDA7_9BASI|nr:hypothetical protein PSHT_09921 [Puccinia striiformis]